VDALAPDTPLPDLDWIPANRTTPLAKLGLTTLGELVTHFPRRHEDRRRFDHFPDGETPRSVCLYGSIAATSLKRIGGWKRMFEAVIEDDGVLTRPIVLRWFNMPYIQKLIATGHRIVVFGRPRTRGKQVVIDHPEFEIVEEDEEYSIHMNRITPVHPAGEGVTTRLLRTLIHRALGEVDLAALPNLQPAGSFDKAAAIRSIHFPETADDLAAARESLVIEEFLGVQLLLGWRRRTWEALPGSAKQPRGELLERLVDRLPFPLTESQCAVIEEIRLDLSAPRRMNRLLQGDVGSGKTLVALASMLLAVESGHQAALMAPTQILAEQHYLTFRRLLEPLGIPVALRTGTKSAAAASKKSPGSTRVPRVVSGVPPETGIRYSKRNLPHFERPWAKYAITFSTQDGGTPRDAASGTRDACAPRIPPSILIGTHALLYEPDGLDSPGLVVIDEQHKFGVLQRAKLIELGGAPDVLMMTATPIPRTITQSLYGDLDISILKEKPAQRGTIQTVARPDTKLPETLDFLRKQLDKGRQAYVVYPLVEESDKLAAKSAKSEFEKWVPLVAPHRAALLHGRLGAEEKETVMTAFRRGEIAVLIATTVIEVGVDVPNATVLVVENAERFGLAQLHQLRGRIGRGEHKSFCILLHDPKAANLDKLSILEKTSDGFEIAEADLAIRGPGDLLGTVQTGLPPLKLGNLFNDAPLMLRASVTAKEIFLTDPRLDSPDHVALRRFVSETPLSATD